MTKTLTTKKAQAFIIGATRNGATRWLTDAGTFSPNRSEAKIHDCIEAQDATATLQANYNHHEGIGAVTVAVEIS